MLLKVKGKNMGKEKGLLIFGLSHGSEVAKNIAKNFKIEYHEMKTTKFSDGEILVKPDVSVRGSDVMLVQATCPPVNDNLMELLIAIDAAKNASANSITVLIPYYGYARQDRKSAPREPITSRLVARMIERAGASKILFVDIHSHSTSGYFSIRSENVGLSSLFCNFIADEMNNNHPHESLALVSPDYGGVIRVRQSARILEGLEPQVAIMDKRRPKPNSSEILHVLGEVRDKVCFIIDDMIDTGGTICKSAETLKKKGAKDIYVLASHGLLSGDACKNLGALVEKGVIKKVVISDSIRQTKEKYQLPWLKIIYMDSFLAGFIYCQYNNLSIGKFYRDYKKHLRQKIQAHKLS